MVQKRLLESRSFVYRPVCMAKNRNYIQDDCIRNTIEEKKNTRKIHPMANNCPFTKSNFPTFVNNLNSQLFAQSPKIQFELKQFH